MGLRLLYNIVKLKERMIKMTNLQRKAEIETTTFKVIEGGRLRKKPIERLLGLALVAAGIAVTVADKDATALIFVSFIALPMIFSKKSVILK